MFIELNKVIPFHYFSCISTPSWLKLNLLFHFAEYHISLQNFDLKIVFHYPMLNQRVNFQYFSINNFVKAMVNKKWNTSP